MRLWVLVTVSGQTLGSWMVCGRSRPSRPVKGFVKLDSSVVVVGREDRESRLLVGCPHATSDSRPHALGSVVPVTPPTASSVSLPLLHRFVCSPALPHL